MGQGQMNKNDIQFFIQVLLFVGGLTASYFSLDKQLALVEYRLAVLEKRMPYEKTVISSPPHLTF